MRICTITIFLKKIHISSYLLPTFVKFNSVRLVHQLISWCRGICDVEFDLKKSFITLIQVDI